MKNMTIFVREEDSPFVFYRVEEMSDTTPIVSLYGHGDFEKMILDLRSTLLLDEGCIVVIHPLILVDGTIEDLNNFDGDSQEKTIKNVDDLLSFVLSNATF